jgi:hypothetical protein
MNDDDADLRKQIPQEMQEEVSKQEEDISETGEELNFPFLNERENSEERKIIELKGRSDNKLLQDLMTFRYVAPALQKSECV